MSEIALYNLLKRIPDATDDEVKEVVADVAKKEEVATKLEGVATKLDIAELKAELDAKIERMARLLIMWMVGMGAGLFLGQAIFMFNVLKFFLSD